MQIQSSIFLVHWNAVEAQPCIAMLEQAGYLVRCLQAAGRDFLKDLAQDPPCAVVIDLARLPSQGRDLAVLIRNQKSTRQLPLVFTGGNTEKNQRLRDLLPDAFFTNWEEILPALTQAISHPPQDPVVPGSAFAAYAGKPLLEKLGIRKGIVLGLLDPPPDFVQTLGNLPDGVPLKQGIEGSSLVLWFVRSQRELEVGVVEIAARLHETALWIAWPKKISFMISNLSERTVRNAGLDSGLVDYKICSIDDTWSGLLFRKRKPQQGIPQN